LQGVRRAWPVTVRVRHTSSQPHAANVEKTMDYTPAHEFLSELGDINAFILDALNSPRKAQWHWPSYYLLYVDVDRLASLLVRVKYLFRPPFEQPGEPPAAEERVADANELFAQIDRLQKAVVQWLFQMYRYTDANPADPAGHRRLGAHVHPKSGWYQTFMSDFCSGVLAADGNTLQRVALPIDAGTVGERIDNITARCMLRQQVFDLGSPAAREALAHATDEAQSRLGRVIGTMTAFLAANCDIADLLHPCSH
jgi:hypothetical protein